MDWSNETYVRVYIRDTATWLKMRWQGECLFMQLLRKVDRSGRLDGITDPIDDLSLVTGLPEDVVEYGLKKLQKYGVIEINNGILIIPNYIEAQTASKSDKQRQRESRENRRLEAISSDTSIEKSVKPSKEKENFLISLKGFDEFWLYYPKKVGKQAAKKAWKRAIKDECHEVIIESVKTQKKWPQWLNNNGQYIPNPATWLNQGRWEDETEPNLAKPIEVDKEYEEAMATFKFK